MTSAPSLAAAVSAAFAIAAAGVFPAQAAPADAQLHDVLQQYRSADARGQWVNALMPEATGLASVAPGAAPSGDRHLNQLVATYTREQLDRGGWANAWVREDHYAAGEPLLAVRVGEGVTTRVAAGPVPVQQFALGLRR
jgi:hypothetical protein